MAASPPTPVYRMSPSCRHIGMAYTLERTGHVLTMMVTNPKVENSPRALTDLKKHIDEGGITEVWIGFDEAAWQSGWAEHSLTALEGSLADIGISLGVVGPDARLTASESRRT